MTQVAHLRRRLEPHLLVLHDNANWEQAEDSLEALRRLRVATRRLRAFTRLFAPLIGTKRADRLHKQLRRVTRGVGPLREREVLLDDLRAEHSMAKPLLRAALEHLIADTERHRVKAARKTRKAVARIDVSALAHALDAELDRICGRMLRLDDALPTQVWTLLEPTMARAFDDLPTPRHEHEIEPLHEVRVRAKRLRYALELLRPTLGEEAYQPLRKPAKLIQRAIGEHHDRSLLARAIRQHHEALTEQGLLTLAEALRPLEKRVLAQRRAAHEAALPALELLLHRRYVTLATKALGISKSPPVPTKGRAPGTSTDASRRTDP